jgi:hypothetical protein
LKGVTAALEVLSSDDAQATFKSARAPISRGWGKDWEKPVKLNIHYLFISVSNKFYMQNIGVFNELCTTLSTDQIFKRMWLLQKAKKSATDLGRPAK